MKTLLSVLVCACVYANEVQACDYGGGIWTATPCTFEEQVILDDLQRYRSNQYQDPSLQQIFEAHIERCTGITVKAVTRMAMGYSGMMGESRISMENFTPEEREALLLDGGSQMFTRCLGGMPTLPAENVWEVARLALDAAKVEVTSQCDDKGKKAAATADAYYKARPGAKQLSAQELRGLHDKVFGQCMGQMNVSQNDKSTQQRQKPITADEQARRMHDCIVLGDDAAEKALKNYPPGSRESSAEERLKLGILEFNHCMGLAGTMKQNTEPLN